MDRGQRLWRCDDRGCLAVASTTDAALPAGWVRSEVMAGQRLSLTLCPLHVHLLDWLPLQFPVLGEGERIWLEQAERQIWTSAARVAFAGRSRSADVALSAMRLADRVRELEAALASAIDLAERHIEAILQVAKGASDRHRLRQQIDGLAYVLSLGVRSSPMEASADLSNEMMNEVTEKIVALQSAVLEESR